MKSGRDADGQMLTGMAWSLPGTAGTLARQSDGGFVLCAPCYGAACWLAGVAPLLTACSLQRCRVGLNIPCLPAQMLEQHALDCVESTAQANPNHEPLPHPPRTKQIPSSSCTIHEN